MLLALHVLTPTGDTPSVTGRDVAGVTVDDDLLQFPLRLSDEAVAELLSPGDVVDVLGSEIRGATTVVAHDVSVVEVPPPSGAAFGSGESGLVVVAVAESTALDLAAAVTRGPVTVTLHP